MLHHMPDDGVVTGETLLTMEAKSSWLATIDPRDRPFMTELADTQLFQSHISREFDAFSPSVRGSAGGGGVVGKGGGEGGGGGLLGGDGGHAVEELSRQLSKSTRRLARVEQVLPLSSLPPAPSLIPLPRE